MRTIVDIPDPQVKILNQLSKKKKISRAAIIRQALADFIISHSKTRNSYKAAFGIWNKKKINSIDYQNKLRNEWK